MARWGGGRERGGEGVTVAKTLPPSHAINFTAIEALVFLTCPVTLPNLLSLSRMAPT